MRLSIVICAYNEGKSIGPLLENLACQKIPEEIEDQEIIVVASGCTDATVDVVRQQLKKNANISLVEEERRLGKASALNKAFESCHGDYIALVPADVEPAPDALFNLIIPFRDASVSAVSGRPMQNPWRVPKGFTGYLSKMTYRLWGKLMSKLDHHGEIGHCSGEFMAIRKDVKMTIPRECAADDSYVAIAAKRKGLIRFAPTAICYNLLPSNLADYVNQRRRWLYGHFQTKKITGEYPTVLDTIVLSRPRIAFEVLVEEIGERPKETGYLFGAMLVEVAIYLLSMLDRLSSRQYGVWPVIGSTKLA